VSILINSAYAQSLDNSSNAQSLDNFVTYTDDDLNFTIQRPSNWEVEEDPIVPDSVSFRIPNRDIIGSFSVSVKKIEPYLDTDTMTLQNTSLQQYAQQRLDIGISTFIYKPLRQSEVTVGGNTGIKHEFSSNYHYYFEIITIANGKFYILSYADEPLKVPETLPLANKMVESFQVGLK
jgi:hypothetical protein